MSNVDDMIGGAVYIEALPITAMMCDARRMLNLASHLGLNAGAHSKVASVLDKARMYDLFSSVGLHIGPTYEEWVGRSCTWLYSTDPDIPVGLLTRCARVHDQPLTETNNPYATPGLSVCELEAQNPWLILLAQHHAMLRNKEKEAVAEARARELVIKEIEEQAKFGGHTSKKFAVRGAKKKRPGVLCAADTIREIAEFVYDNFGEGWKSVVAVDKRFKDAQ